jgi:trigger factor
MSDKVTIDTDGYDLEGKFLESTSMRQYPIILGSNMLVPGFEEQIAGMQVGEKKEIDVVFPSDYHNASFAGKKTKFQVTIHKLEKSHKPEFTSEFIKELRGKDLDLAGFKKLIESELTETKEANARMEEEIQLIEALLKVTKLEIGSKLLANQIDKVYVEIKENMSKDGVQMAHYLESLRLSEEEYKEKNVKQVAMKRLQGELILHRLMEMEKTEVSDSEVLAETEKVLARYGSEDVLMRLRELYVPGTKYYEELKLRIGYRKLIDSFFA